MVGNIEAESNFVIDAKGDGILAKGLFLMHPNRRDVIKKATGIDMSCADVEDQCLGCKWELDGPEKHAGLLLKAAETAYNSGYIVAKFYERPADFNEWDKRGKLADKWYEYFTQPAQAGLNNE